ncbi:MAG: WD40 repeat domain-containing protein [Blastocatellia bacterium]
MRRLSRTIAALISILLVSVPVWAQSPSPEAVRLARTFTDSTGIYFSPDGRSLAVIATDGGVRLVDLMTGSASHTLAGVNGSVYELLWSGDNQKLAVFKKAGKEGWVIEVWNLGTGEQRATIKVPSWEYHITWGSNSDRLLIIGGKGIAQSWDAENGRLISEIRSKKKLDYFAVGSGPMAWTPDGRRLVINDNSGTLQLFNGETGQLIANLQQYPERMDVTDSIWISILPGRCYKSPTGVESVILADGARLLTISSRELPKLWDLETGRMLATLQHPLEKNGKWPGSDFKCLLYDFKTKPEWERAGENTIFISFDHGFGLWDTVTGKSLRYFPKAGLPSLFLDDGKTMITFWEPRGEDLKFSQIFSNTDEVRFYDLATGEMKKQWKKPSVNRFYLRFSPTGKTIVTRAGIASESNIVLADAETGQIKAKLPTNDCESDALIYTSCYPFQVNQRGKLIVTQAKDKIRLWDSEEGQLIDYLTEAKKPALFSLDGKWLATGSKQKKTMLLWEVIRN